VFARFLLKRWRRIRHREAACIVVRNDPQMGELLLTTPLLQSLAEQYGPVDVVVSANQSEVLDGATFVHRQYAVPKRGLFQPLALCRSLARIPIGYEIVVDAGHRHEMKSSAWISYVIGGHVRLGHRRGAHRAYYSMTAPLGPDDAHEIDRKLELLEPLDIKPLTRSLWVRRKWTHNRSSLNLAIVYLGSRRLTHRIPVRIALDAIRSLESLQFKALLLIGRDEYLDRDVPAELLDVATKCVRISSIGDFEQAFSTASLVIATNSGPMHLAAGMGVPMVALFQAGSLKRWGYNALPHLALNLNEIPVEDFSSRFQNAVRRAICPK
jgi:ADP-heptose:LPS heptosyltransferase